MALSRFRPAEEIEVDAGIEPAIAGEATDCLDLPVVVAGNFDAAALGHEMQDALLRAGNVHVLRSGIAPDRAHKNDLALFRTSGLRFFGPMRASGLAGRASTGSVTGST